MYKIDPSKRRVLNDGIRQHKEQALQKSVDAKNLRYTEEHQKLLEELGTNLEMLSLLDNKELHTFIFHKLVPYVTSKDKNKARVAEDIISILTE